jgi:hypothetical protein
MGTTIRTLCQGRAVSLQLGLDPWEGYTMHAMKSNEMAR